MNILFICSRNQWRSPTAEEIYRKHPGLNVRSAGTASSARVKVTGKLIDWADLIMVMEKRHKQQLYKQFPEALAEKEVIVLDIPDDYTYMDPELVASIQASVDPYIDSI